MELKYFRLIKTIAEEGNIANATDRLFLTQSALSHQLRDLEDRLGFKVFLRARNKWKLTEEGEELYRLANKVLAEIEQGMKGIEDIRQGSKGRIRISTECYSFYRGLPAPIQKMGVLYPEIEIDLIAEATLQAVPKLLTNEIDLAIATSGQSNEKLLKIELFEDVIMAVVHKENPLSKKEFIEAQDFKDVHLIIHSFPMESVAVYEYYLKPNGVEPAKVTAIPLTEVALEMVDANMGVMCVPKWALRATRVPKDLVLKRIGENRVRRKHYVVIRKEDEGKKYINDFITSIQQEFIGEE